MTIELGKEYQTRDGQAVRIYATDGGGLRPIHGAVEIKPGVWDLWHWRADGQFSSSTSLDMSSIYDLVPKPKRIHGWVRAWVTEANPQKPGLGTEIFPTREAALGSIQRVPYAIVEVDFVEGQGLEGASK